MAEFVRLEDVYHDAADGGWIECSFRSTSRNQGIIVRCLDGDVKELNSQPSLYMYPDKERGQIVYTTKAIYLMVFGVRHTKRLK